MFVTNRRLYVSTKKRGYRSSIIFSHLFSLNVKHLSSVFISDVKLLSRKARGCCVLHEKQNTATLILIYYCERIPFVIINTLLAAGIILVVQRDGTIAPWADLINTHGTSIRLHRQFHTERIHNRVRYLSFLTGQLRVWSTPPPHQKNLVVYTPHSLYVLWLRQRILSKIVLKYKPFNFLWTQRLHYLIAGYDFISQGSKTL